MEHPEWAIVLGSGLTGLGAVRSLHQAGIPVVAVALRPDKPALYSRYPEKIVVPASEASEDALLETLLKTGEGRPILIPTSDFFVRFMSRHRQELSQRFACCIPCNELTETLIDKAKETRLMAAMDVPMPKTMQELPDWPDDLIQDLGLPLIIKARSFEHRGILGFNIKFIDTANALRTFYRDYRFGLNAVIAQEVIPGGPGSSWVCDCTFNRDSELIRALVFRKIRSWPPDYGTTTYGRSELNDAIVAIVRDLGRRLRYIGPADIDFVYDPRDREYKYIEINPRVGACNYLGVLCGINSVLDAYRVTNGEEVPVDSREQIEGMLYFDFFHDLRSYIRGRRSYGLKNYIKALSLYLTRCAHPHFCWTDVGPAVFVCSQYVRRLLQFARDRLARWAGDGSQAAAMKPRK